MIRQLIYWVLLLFVCMGAHAQFRVTAHQEGWDRIPPQAQKDGFWFQQSVLANMDDDTAMEEVMLFGRDNGHYPTFDLFKFYYVIVDNYTREIQYISDEIYVTDKYTLTVEDRNNDGISELYIIISRMGSLRLMSEDIICEPPVATTVSNGAPRVKNLTPNNHEKVYLFYSAYLLRLISLNLLRPEKGDKNDDDRRARWQSLLARCLRGHEADLREQWNV